MKPTILLRQVLLVLLALVAIKQSAEAIPMVSNLGYQFTPNQGIGDIEGVFRGGAHYGSYSAHFTTGAGNNYSINTITLEFEYDASYPAGLSAQQYLNVQLFKNVGSTSILLGSFGNPVVNPLATQWPQSSHPRAYTTFIDFSPLAQMLLNPSSQYSVVLSMPSSSPTDAALMFAKSSAYNTSPAGWTMGLVTSGNTYANSEYLIMAVDATAIPDQSNSALLLFGGFMSLVGARHLFKVKPYFGLA